MRKLLPTLAVALVAAAAAPPAYAQLQAPRVSPAAKVSLSLGSAEMTVAYSRPGVKNRVIWGELVPYDQPWRTGANEATTFTTTQPVKFGGQDLAPGTYSLATIPGKSGWTLALNSEKDLWGTMGYKPEKDVLRVSVTPSPAEHQEWLEFGFEGMTANSAYLTLHWEKLKLAVPITVDVNGLFLADARKAMETRKADDWRTPFTAARFCFDNKVAMDEGAKWLQQSVGTQKTAGNMGLLARWQAADGKTKEAIASGEEAIKLGKAATPPADVSAMEKQVADWKAGKK